MKYQPKIVYNPTNKAVEFMCDRVVYRFAPREKRILEGFVAYHALNQVNTGLVEYSIEDKEEAVVTADTDYDNMAWRDLVSIGSAEGIYAPGKGMSKEKLIAELKKLDEQKKRAV